jgi:hypothetical protein
MENTEENSEKTLKLWKKASWIVKRYGKYRRKASWIVKRYGKYGRKVSWIVKREGNYGRIISQFSSVFSISRVDQLFVNIEFLVQISYKYIHLSCPKLLLKLYIPKNIYAKKAYGVISIK